MPELVLLTLDRAKLRECRSSAKHGDTEAQRELNALWSEYDSVDLECFLCGGTVEKPVVTLLLPEHDAADKAICAPLCVECRDLSVLQQMNRAFKLLKKMWKKKGGPQIHFFQLPR